MDLNDRIKLLEDMIKENRDVTIREYLEALKEIENIKPLKTIQLCLAS